MLVTLAGTGVQASWAEGIGSLQAVAGGRRWGSPQLEAGRSQP